MNREEMKAYANRVIDLGLNDETQDFCKSVISALSAEGEYIKKEELLNSVIIQDSPYGDFEEKVVTIEDIEKLPTYSFPDREKGEWIATENEEMEVDGYFCSKCDSPMPTDEKTSFCPFCGADMRRDKADE